MSIEKIRSRYRPDQVRVLFVGESPPTGGEFFYCGNSQMFKHMRRILGKKLFEDSSDFLANFKEAGCYLDDLVLSPCKPSAGFRRKWIPCLANRIAEYRPPLVVVVHGRFPPEMGARILSALDAAMDAHAEEQPAAAWEHEHATSDVPRGTSETDAQANAADSPGVPTSPDVPRGTRPRGPSRTVCRADALAWIAERVFEPASAPPLSPQLHEVVVHVDAEVLAHRNAGRCEIEHRSAIAAETARRLCCDGGIVATVDGPRGEPLGVGRRTRAIPPSIRRALHNRDHGCRFPGCPATHRLHGHHVRHWANGGETALDNLVLLCPTHHRLVHEGGFEVRRLDDGAFRFSAPSGVLVGPPKPSEASAPGTLVDHNRSLGLDIGAGAATARWLGEPVDYDHALLVLMAAWDAGHYPPRPGSSLSD